MQYEFNLDNPLFFVNSEDSVDTSKKYSVVLPYDWHEVANNTEWVTQYPMNHIIDRQGWKVHISATFEDSHEILDIVAQVCHEFLVTFKHLSTEKRFILRNSKIANRGYSGKFITCYPGLEILENFLNSLEQKLKDFSGPYILSDKRWERAPIYLRYGVFRDAIPNQEEPLKIDELLISGKSVKDSREPRFVVPEGIALPVFLKKWLEGSEQTESQDFPFVIKSAIRFSNSGGIYRAHLKEANKEVILREVRPYTGLDFDGKYSSDRLTAEESALVKLKDMCSVPDVLWSGTVWEHRYLAVDKMKGIPLNRWVTKNYPIYDFAVGDKKYLSRIYSILTELISLVEEAHSRNVFHQDIHLANILIDENDNVSLIDWEQARFDDTNKVEQQAAALGFGSWINDFPSQIDWYGVKQVAHYLFFPLLEQSAFVCGYELQLLKHAKELFTRLDFPQNDIDAVERTIEYLDQKVTPVRNLTTKKIVKPFNDSIEFCNQLDVLEYYNKLVRGLYVAYNEWNRTSKGDRKFPVHYYGLDINQGIAYSDLGILWGYRELVTLLQEEDALQGEFFHLKQAIIQKTISSFDNDKFSPGLFDGIVGSIWIIYKLGEIDLAKKLFVEHFNSLLNQCESKNLYSGGAGILLVGIYMFSKGLDDELIENKIIEKLELFSREYQKNPNSFCPVGKSETQSNDPYQNTGGLLYGHLGLGWLFGEAFRYTHNELYKECLNLAILTELEAYDLDRMGSLQYHQGNRLLPYLSTGSAGMLLVIVRNSQFLDGELLNIQDKLEKAVDSNFCVFPGLFNGLCGLELSKRLYRGKNNPVNDQRELLKKLSIYFSSIERGVIIAGDSGLKITTDIASGFGGIALSLISLQNNQLELLPHIS